MTAAVTKAAFARQQGLAASRITQLIAEGMPVQPDGKINASKASQWMAKNLDSHRREARKPGSLSGSGTTTTAAQVRTAKLFRETKLLDLQLQQAEGKLIDRAKAEAAIFERARLERDSLLAWAARSAPVIANETGADPTVVFATLDRLVREHLDQMAGTPLEVLRG